MTKMKVNDICKKAIKLEKLPTLYGWGKYFNTKSGKYYLCDCSGLIKGILWGYPEKGRYGSNGVPDMNADTMISRCSNVTTDMSKLQKGWLVWMKGHIGIYVGDGLVVESSPIWENGVQRTYPKGCGKSNIYGLKSRQWTKCGKLDKYIDYVVDKPTSPAKPTVKDTWVADLQKELNKQYRAGLVVDGIVGPKTKSACPTVKKGAKGNITKLIQKRLNSVGFHITEDGDFGTNTYNSIKVFQKNRGLSQDGIVGNNTWTYLLSGKKY